MTHFFEPTIIGKDKANVKIVIPDEDFFFACALLHEQNGQIYSKGQFGHNKERREI